MARSRNIKPGFCENEHLGRLPAETRLLFAVLPMFADREGRLEDRPMRIRVQAFPYDSFDVDPMLQQLHDAGFIVRYVVSNIQYIQIVNFSKHQSPHVKEAASTIPAPDKHQTSPIKAPDKPDKSTSAAPPDCGLLIPDSLIPDSLKKLPTTSEAAASPDLKKELFDLAIDVLCPRVTEGQARSLAGKMLKVCDQDTTEAFIVLRDCQGKQDPPKYLAACIRDRQTEAKKIAAQDEKARQQIARQEAFYT